MGAATVGRRCALGEFRALIRRSVRIGWTGGTVIATDHAPFSEEPGMLRSRLVLATFLVVACAACGSKAADPAPTATSLATTSAPSVPTSSGATELAGYTEAERRAYDEAVRAYTAFMAENDRLLAEGTAGAEAVTFFQHNSTNWSQAWDGQKKFADLGVRVTGPTRVLRTQPVRIDIGPNARRVVVLKRCLDESARVVTQNGKTQPQPQFATPHAYTVRLVTKSGETWWRAGIAKRGHTC
jgi:hypothetical protein